MLPAVGDSETDPAALAALADQKLRATAEQLRHLRGVRGSSSGLSAAGER
jgi:hypothetical protein